MSHLRTFHAVAREGGFSKAARIVGVSQPTLSIQVQALEEGYGVALFDRRGRGVRLTEFGTELLAITSQLFACADEAEELMSGGRELQTGHLKLGATGPHQIVPIMAAFSKRYPGLQVSLLVRNGSQLLQALRDRRIDITVHSDPPDDPALGSIPLRIDPIVVCVAPDHSWANRKSVTLRDLKEEVLILRERGTVTRTVIDKAFAKSRLKLSPERIMEITDWESVRELVAAGLGVSPMSLPDAGESKRIVRVPLQKPELEIAEFLVFHEERRRLRIVRAFLDVAMESS